MTRLELISDIINEWDPIHLFPYAPLDEYHDEIIIIDRFCGRIEDGVDYDLGFEIYQLFKGNFGEDVFDCAQSDCDLIATKIINSIHSKE